MSIRQHGDCVIIESKFADLPYFPPDRPVAGALKTIYFPYRSLSIANHLAPRLCDRARRGDPSGDLHFPSLASESAPAVICARGWFLRSTSTPNSFVWSRRRYARRYEHNPSYHRDLLNLRHLRCAELAIRYWLPPSPSLRSCSQTSEPRATF